MKAYRLDFGRIDAPDKSPNGYLKANAYVTRIGVFEYRLPNGITRKELRPPDEVFDWNSLNTLAEVPVTNDHPPVMLDSRNTKKYAVGMTSDKVEKENIYVKCKMTVTDQETIDALENYEKQETSCGYTCALEETPGEWEGEQYDAIQRDIVYNHVAIVQRGRAGSAVRVHMDGADIEAGIQIKNDKADEAKRNALPQGDGTPLDKSSKPSAPEDKKDENKQEDNMVKVTLMGKEYDASEELAKAVEANEKAHSDATSKLDEAVKSADALKGRVDALEADVKAKSDELEKAKAEKLDRAAIMKIARDRLAIETFAKSVLGEDAEKMDFDKLSDVELHKAVVLKADPTAKLDGKSDDYIASRYDYLVEKGVQKPDPVADALKANARGDGSSKEFDDVAARKAAMDRAQNAWKVGLEK